jgi:hypothetical protein
MNIYFVFRNYVLLSGIQTEDFYVLLEVPSSHNYIPASSAINATDYARCIHECIQ